MKRFPLFSLASLVLFGLIFLPPAFSQTNETLTISTYYPSPYGVYKELRLYPNINPTPCDDSTEGNMYYDDDKNEVMVCRGLLGGWQSMGLWTLDGTSLYPTNTTWNVGIGTQNPQGKFHIYDLKGPTTMGNVWFGGTSPLYSDMQFDGASDGIFVFTNTGIASGGTVFYSSTTGQMPLVIQNAGNVGIGTTSPQPVGWTGASGIRLGVEGGAIRSNNNRLYLTGNDGAGMFWINRGPDEGGDPITNSGGDNVIGWSNAAGFAGRVINLMGTTLIGAFSPTPLWGRQNLYVSGDVGIGTTSPGAKLEVTGQVKITGGTPGAGKVLTTLDGSGLATWEPSSHGQNNCYWTSDTQAATCNVGYYLAGFDCTGDCDTSAMKMLCCQF